MDIPLGDEAEEPPQCYHAQVRGWFTPHLRPSAPQGQFLVVGLAACYREGPAEHGAGRWQFVLPPMSFGPFGPI